MIMQPCKHAQDKKEVSLAGTQQHNLISQHKLLGSYMCLIVVSSISYIRIVQACMCTVLLLHNSMQSYRNLHKRFLKRNLADVGMV